MIRAFGRHAAAKDLTGDFVSNDLLDLICIAPLGPNRNSRRGAEADLDSVDTTVSAEEGCVALVLHVEAEGLRAQLKSSRGADTVLVQREAAASAVDRVAELDLDLGVVEVWLGQGGRRQATVTRARPTPSAERKRVGGVTHGVLFFSICVDCLGKSRIGSSLLLPTGIATPVPVPRGFA